MRTFTPEEDIPGGLLDRELEIDACYGEPNRNSQVVKSVDRLASSCRGIERCRLGSSCASGKEKLRSRIKSLCEGAWTTFYACIISGYSRDILLPAIVHDR